MYEFENECDCDKSKPIIREGLGFCNEDCYLNWKASKGMI